MREGQPAPRHLLPILASLASGFCFGVIPYFAIQLFAAGFSPLSVLVWRVGVSCLILLGLALFLPSAREEWRTGWTLSLVGVIGAVQSFCFFMSMKFLATSFATLIFFMYPLVTMLLERFVFGSRQSTGTAIALPLVVIGAALTLYSGLNADQLGRPGAAWALPVPLLYAIFLSLSARIGAPRHPISRAIRLQVGMLLGYLPIALHIGVQAPANAVEWQLVLTCALAGGILGVSFFAYGIQQLGASVFGIVAALELVTVVGIGLLILGESLRPGQIVGMLLILAAILISALPRDILVLARRTP